MKRAILFGLFIAGLLIMPLGNTILKADYQPLAVTSILCANGLDPAYPPELMLDDNPQTVWRTAGGSGNETALVINLSEPARIIGLKLMISEASFDSMAVEYNNDGVWQPFTGYSDIRPEATGEWRTLDLSYDRVRGNLLRIRLSSKNTRSYLGSIAGLQISGVTETHPVKLPVTFQTTGSQELFSIANLGDGNTESRWECPADAKGLASFTITCPAVSLAAIKFYLPGEVKGTATLEAWQNGAWKAVSGAAPLTGLKTGWNSVSLANLTTEKLRLSFTNPMKGLCGGFSEVEVWGTDASLPVKRLYDSGLAGVDSQSQPKTLRVSIPKLALSADYYLAVTATGPLNDSISLNGAEVKLGAAPRRIEGLYLYRLPVSSLLKAGDNQVALSGTQAALVTGLMIEEISNCGLLTNWKANLDGLNDQLLFSGVSLSEVELTFPDMARLDRIDLFAEVILNQVEVWGDRGAGWERLSTEQSQGKGVYTIQLNAAGFTAQRIKLVMPYKLLLQEIECWGGPVSHSAPLLNISSPVDGQVLGVNERTVRVKGTTDQPEATITINGTAVTAAGERFDASLIAPAGETSYRITVEARNRRGQVTTIQRTVFFGSAPALALDQTAAEYFVSSEQFTLSGLVNVDNLMVTVNGAAAELQNRRFSQAVTLHEGANRIIIRAEAPGGAAAEKQITVHLDKTPPLLRIAAPLSGQLLSSPTVTVSGTVSDATPCSVKVNGQTAPLSGSSFNLTINLAAGTNNIAITAEDKAGNTAAASLSVTYVNSKPKLTVSAPIANQIFTSQQVTVRGSVSDTLPVAVSVNNHPAAVANGLFEMTLELADGVHELRVRAVNTAGAETISLVNIIVDTIKPSALEVQTEPAGWSNIKQPLVRFAASDAASGIDHYQLKLDNQAYAKATSPYRLPVLSDGEHTISVKAVDKAGWETEASVKIRVDTKAPILSDVRSVSGRQKLLVRWEINEANLAYYRIKRIPAFSEGELKLGPEETEFHDDNVQPRADYKYALMAVDHAGNNTGWVETGIAEPNRSRKQINPNTDSRIEDEDVEIEVPAGAHREAKTLVISRLTDNPSLEKKAGGRLISPLFYFGAIDANNQYERDGVKFNKPVRVKIRLDQLKIKQIKNPEYLKVCYFSPATGGWQEMLDSKVDVNKKFISFTTTHFSIYSVLASVPGPLTPEDLTKMGISPGKGKRDQVDVDAESGRLNIESQDFTRNGRGGMDFAITRIYNSKIAEADWELEPATVLNKLREALSSSEYYVEPTPEQVNDYINKHIGQYRAFGMGRGWRLGITCIENIGGAEYIRFASGSAKRLVWTMDGAGWGNQGHASFTCHAGAHFQIVKTQVYVKDILDSEGNKVGEEWKPVIYTMTSKDGAVYQFDAAGRPISITNRLGTSTIQFFYRQINDIFKLDYILDSTGHRFDFAYNSSAQINTISGAGKSVSYQYTGHNLTGINDGGIIQNGYGYNSSNRLTGVTTPLQGEYQMVYNSSGQVTNLKAIGSAFTREISYGYSSKPSNRYTNVYEGSRRVKLEYIWVENEVEGKYLPKRRCVFGTADRLIEWTDYEYNAALETVTKVTKYIGEHKNIMEYSHDNWGNLKWQKQYLVRTARGVDTEGNEIISYSYTTLNESYFSYANTNTTTITHNLALANPYSAVTINNSIHNLRTGALTINYKTSGTSAQQAWYNYAANGNLLGQAVRLNGGWLQSSYEPDSYGNMIKTIDPRGVETRIEYGAAYNYALPTKVILARLTGADGAIQTNVVLKEIGYDPVTFWKRWEKDARGYVSERQYDGIGRLTATVLPDDNDPADYRPAGSSGPVDRSGLRSDNPYSQIIYKMPERTTTMIDPLGNQTDYLYDTQEHLVEVVKFKKLLGVPFAYSRIKISYDNRGNIAKIVSPNGAADLANEYKHATQYLYDEANRLLKVILPDETENTADNPFQSMAYDDTNHITYTTNENGMMTVSFRDLADRTVEVIAAYETGLAVSLKTEYDGIGNTLAVTDGRGSTTNLSYDDLNRLITKALPAADMLNDANGSAVNERPQIGYIYDAMGNLLQETGPLGNPVTYRYDDLNRKVESRVEFTVMNGVRRTAITRYFYDLSGNLVKTVDPQGKVNEAGYTAQGWVKWSKDAMGNLTTFTYDLLGNKLSATDPRGNAPGAAPNSFTIWYEYDELYRVVKAVLPDESPENLANNPAVSFEYDYNGNCVRETKANGHFITYTYNGRNWLLSQTQVLNGRTYTTRFEYDAMGNKIYVYDGKNNRSAFEYDLLGREVLRTAPEGNAAAAGYDANGNKTWVRDGRNNTSNFSYDALNRLVQAVDADGKYAYSYYDREGRVTKSVSRTGLIAKSKYNEIGLVLEATNPLGLKTVYDYDVTGKPIYKKSPRGVETRFSYDDLYRVLRSDLTLGTRSQFTAYEYDNAGNVKRSYNEAGAELIYNTYDGAYRSNPYGLITKVEQVMPGGTRYSTEYRYDIMNNLTGIRYPNSADWLSYEYDAMNRAIAIPGFAGTSANPGITYDENSAVQGIRLDNGAATTFERNKNGQVTRIQTLSGDGSTLVNLNYAYDMAGNIINRNDNSYVYDKLNRLLKAALRGTFEEKLTKGDLLLGKTDQDHQGKKEVEQDVTNETRIKLDISARSLVINLQSELENISRVEIAPDQAGHRLNLEQIEIYYRSGLFFTKLERSKWVGRRDEKGRLIIRFQPMLQTGELKINCRFNDLDLAQLPVDRAEFGNEPSQMVAVFQYSDTREETYTYDAMGNRLTEQIVKRRTKNYNYQYYANSTRLLSDGRYAYVYDLDGNLIKKGNKFSISGQTVTFTVTSGDGVEYYEYTYDLYNRMEAVRKNGVPTATHAYSPNGFRIQKNGPKGEVHYVPLFNGEVGYKKELASGKEQSFIYLFGRKLARVDGVIGGSGRKVYYHNDHLGSALVLTDSSGNKLAERDFTPFGEINTGEEGTDADDSGFTGKDYDPDAGLYYFNARWYDYRIGRFTSEDPIAADPNLYGYCSQNPMNAVDPSGLFETPGEDTPTQTGYEADGPSLAESIIAGEIAAGRDPWAVGTDWSSETLATYILSENPEGMYISDLFQGIGVSDKSENEYAGGFGGGGGSPKASSGVSSRKVGEIRAINALNTMWNAYISYWRNLPDDFYKDQKALESSLHLLWAGIQTWGARTTPTRGWGINDHKEAEYMHMVMAIQAVLGVTVDGKFGPQTQTAMYSELNGIFGSIIASTITGYKSISPMSHKNDMRNFSREEFVRVTYHYALQEEERTGIPAAITTAQIIHESAYGKCVPIDRTTGQYSYNFAGIKGVGPAGTVYCRTREVDANKVSYYTIAGFKAYNNFPEFIEDHSKVLLGSRYSSLFETKDISTWAYSLGSVPSGGLGYATEDRTTYGNALMDYVNQWGLR